MKIGIDIDDTLTYAHGLRLAYGQKFDYEQRNGKSLKNPNGRDTTDIFDWDEETDLQLWWGSLSKAERENKPREFAKEVIQNLRENGHSIYIISARDKQYFKNPYEESKEWLEKNEIAYDKLIVECKQKAKYCKQIGVEVFLDDKEQNCEALEKEGIKTFLFDNVFNQNVTNKNITRVYSFVQFYYEICALEKKSHMEMKKT